MPLRILTVIHSLGAFCKKKIEFLLEIFIKLSQLFIEIYTFLKL